MRTIVLVSALLLSACARPDDATRVLMDAGYTDVQITGYRVFGCSDDDTFQTGFKAKGPTGRSTSGVVCQGVFLKNSTIRLD